MNIVEVKPERWIWIINF